MSKPAPVFRPIGPLDIPDEQLNALSDSLGVPSMVKPPPFAVSTEKAQAAPANKRPAYPPAQTRVQELVIEAPALEETAPPEKMTIEVPGYLMQALRRDCAEKRTTHRYLVLMGLKAIGYAVDPADLVPDLRRPRHKT